MTTNKTKVLFRILMIVFFIAVNSAASQTIFAEDLKPIQLSKPQLDRGKSLMIALNERRSSRSFSSKELPLDIISNLLWAAFGVNRQDSGMRTAPSAMNLQEIDIYVAMQKGLYLYGPAQHALGPVMAKDIREFAGVQDFTQAAPLTLIYIADFSKMKGDDERKMFLAATDTGFISQNVYLFCASEGLATVVLSWVDRPALSKIMSLRDDQKIILTQPVGYPK